MLQENLCRLLENVGSVTVSGLRGASSSWFIANESPEKTCLCIVPDEHQISVLEQDIQIFSNRDILTYPSHEIPPYTLLSPDQHISAARLSTLYRCGEKKGSIVITSIEALLRKTMPREILTSGVEYLMAGEDFDQDDLLRRLRYLGYDQVALVQAVGDYSVRGGIIDLYPPPFLIDGQVVHEGPLRLDFFGDTIESIRSFDPYTQRSTGEIPEATLLPVTDILIDNSQERNRMRIARRFQQKGEQNNWSSDETRRIMERTGQGLGFAGMEFFLPLYYEDQSPSCSSAMDFLPEDSLLFLLDPEGINQKLELTLERVHANYTAALQKNSPALEPCAIFWTAGEIQEQIARYRQVRITDFPAGVENSLRVSSTNHQLLKQDISLKRSRLGLLVPLSEQISSWKNNGDQVIICCRSSRHTKNLAELLAKHGHSIEVLDGPVNGITATPASNATPLYLCNRPLSQGFSLIEYKLHILSESELFGEMRLGGRSRKAPKGEPVRFTELNSGDIVVHREHGLGYYRGLTTIEFGSVINDFMLIEYRDNDKLYLPVDRLNLISRYQGLSDSEPRIDKLGAQTWKVTKAKVKEEVWRVAQELLDIYAKREIRQGRQFSAPGPLYNELEESFAFDETPGQAKSIEDVIADLTSDRPMDRLVCGDVGYGKTEVAVRAAFKVVEDGFQAAILVPTTVLAEQHYKTFEERFNGFPVNIGCINRFRTATEQRQLIKDLKNGTIDIIVGTHRLLSKDIQFNNLGLLIIDEEHRFGVSHKEKLKKMRAEVDILTLSATPIPRTLQMSLLSIRDLSVISTPPEHRQPVKTFVARYDELVIKEAITKELRRGGQVFFVHNRVNSINRIAALIQRLVPEAKLAVAHGQMAGKDLEEIMVSFVNKTINVLVSTTIIESGLDIPSANTIVINRADMLGLAEIYQLRGRVGRSSVQSFAYLLVPSLDSLSKDAKERLRALMDCSELGGGFKLAMNDLQIRGGGNLLGVSQSGNIAAIGYDLYLDLLQKTVADLKARSGSGTDLDDSFDPEVKLQLSAYIPDSYIPDISQRYITYRRISALAGGGDAEFEDLKAELTDRYGDLPRETISLIKIIEIKRALSGLRIIKLEQGRDSLVFSFQDDTSLSPEKLMTYLNSSNLNGGRTGRKFTPDGRLIVTAELSTVEQVFSTIDTTLNELHKLATQAG
jgi:transcription-repair coupling factor (superfamily II helicase)